MAKQISLISVGSVTVGALLVYSGFTGKQFSAVARNLIAGKSGAEVPVTGAIMSSYEGSSVSGGGSYIVQAASKYAGVMYRWGHATPQGWDCSGYVNWVLGHDLGMTLPLGIKGFSGKGHGPTALNYYVWTGATTIPREQASPGDLACWPTHIGIVSGTDSMWNAYSTGRPTAETPIDGWGPKGEPMKIRRINAVTGVITV